MMACRGRRAPWRKNRSAIEPMMTNFRMGAAAPVAGRIVAAMAVATRAMVKRSGSRSERKAIDHALRMQLLRPVPEEARILLPAQPHKRRRLRQFEIAHPDLLPFGDRGCQPAIGRKVEGRRRGRR